jgi:endonuclease/exonuclease/phosphatase family metal-dependent hydrolase
MVRYSLAMLARWGTGRISTVASALIIGLSLGGCTPESAQSPAPETQSITSIPVTSSQAIGSAEPSQTVDPEEAAKIAVDLKVMSFSILNSNAGPDQFPGVPAENLTIESRAPAIVEVIRAADPDLIALQDNAGDPRPSTLLKDDLADYVWVQSSTAVPILVRADVFSVSVSGNATLAEGPDINFSWARLRHKATQREFFAFNVQATAGDDDAAAQRRATEINEAITQFHELNPYLSTQYLVLGDFNISAMEANYELRAPLVALSEQKLIDSAEIAESAGDQVPDADSKHNMGDTVNGQWYATVIPCHNRRTDYIFVPLGTVVLESAVFTEPNALPGELGELPIYILTEVIPSDHFPVVARLLFNYY